MKINFEFEKETKNTIRFKAVNEGATIKTVYVEKPYASNIKSLTLEIKNVKK